jgi:Stealth protein CR2, conserved region 2/Stealth protein CR3, conserved region 3
MARGPSGTLRVVMFDAVYTWVDGDRPGFSGELATAAHAHLRETGEAPAPRAIAPNRFRDNGCLRYSLRALWRYAPWIDKIHLVTAGERPAWLDPDHLSVRLVRHEEIFPSTEALPTFNSCAIEACIHRIKGVSDRFLYFNDDIFLMKQLDPSYFTSPSGLPRFRFETWEMFSDLNDPTPVGASAAYCRHLLDKRFGRRPVRLETPHEPVLLDRTILEAMEREWPDDVARTRRHRFRTRRDFTTIRMYIHYQLELALIRSNQTQEPIQIRPTRAGFVFFGVPQPDLETQLRKVMRSDCPFLCINDATGEAGPLAPARMDHDAEVLEAFLGRRFPQPAPWETHV